MTAIETGLTVLAFVLAPGLVVLALLWVRAWLRDRRIERQAADAAIDQFLRREFGPDATLRGGADREAHGMTVPEPMDERNALRAEFDAIIQGLDDAITLDQLTPMDRQVLAMFSTSTFGDEASLILPSGLSLTGPDIRRLIAEIQAHPEQT